MRNKEAVDLTQYILQVWYFPSMELTLSSVRFFVYRGTNSEIQFLGLSVGIHSMWRCINHW